MQSYKEFKRTIMEQRSESDIDNHELQAVVRDMRSIIVKHKGAQKKAGDLFHDVLPDISKFHRFIETTFFPMWKAAGYPRHGSTPYGKVTWEWKEKYIFD